MLRKRPSSLPFLHWLRLISKVIITMQTTQIRLHAPKLVLHVGAGVLYWFKCLLRVGLPIGFLLETGWVSVSVSMRYSYHLWFGWPPYWTTFSFLKGNLTGDCYLQLLKDLIDPLITQVLEEDVNLEGERKLYFQQDKAPSHYNGQVRGFLHTRFLGQWIGLLDSTERQARSPALTPLHFICEAT